MRFQAAAVQFSPSKGDVDGNIDTIARLAHEACEGGADLCVFPESAVTGYALEGAALDFALDARELGDRLAQRLSSVEKPIDLLVGFCELSGGQPYNSAGYFSFAGGKGELVHSYRKFFLPTYGVFDEDRFHARGVDIGVFESRLGRFGVLICEDVWHSILSTLSAVAGAQVLLVPSASPARGFRAEKPGNVLRYERMLRSICEEHGLYAVVSMLAGFEGGKGFTGGSFIANPYGDLIVQCPLLTESIVFSEIDLAEVDRARNNLPLLGDLKGAWPTIQKLVARL